MRKYLSIAIVGAALVMAGCSTESSTNGVGGSTGDSVAASPQESESATPEQETTTEEPAEDLIKSVKISECKIDGDWGVQVKGTITNPSKEVSDLMATIEITNPAGDRIDEAGVMESAVKPGQKVKFSASGLTPIAELGTKKITCTVKSVDRFATS